MTDPREDKLPKWAQELLYEERLKNALRFPDQPRPPPDFNIDGSGYGIGTPNLSAAKGQVLYSFRAGNLFVQQVTDAGYLHSVRGVSGFGSRGSGEYWLSVDDARLAMRWDIATKAARDLLSAATAEPRE